VILLTRQGAFQNGSLNSSPWRAGLGLVLFALGLGFAIWPAGTSDATGAPQCRKRRTGVGNERPLPARPPPHLLRHPARGGWLRGGAELEVDDPRGPRRDLLHLQRDRRGALPDRAVPRYVPDVPSFNQDARTLHLLSGLSHPSLLAEMRTVQMTRRTEWRTVVSV